MFLTVQGGFLGPFAWLLGKIFNFIYNILANDNGIANLGLCIVLFTVIVKLLLLPLNIKQQKVVKINSMIQPEIQKIQKKYKDKKDQESMLKQQQEVQEVYGKYGTSMTGGCLTSFIQIPIIYALNGVIRNIPAYVSKIKDMYQPIAQSVLDTKGSDAQQFIIDFISDNKIGGASYAMRSFKNLTEVGVDNIIDAIANFGVSHLNMLLEAIGMAGNTELVSNVNHLDEVYTFALGINFSEAPGFKLSWALLIPVSCAIFQFLSMKTSGTTSSQGDAATNSMMKSMMFTMPLMSLVFTVSLPAGLGVYWAMSAMISFITQVAVNQYYNHQDMDAILAKQMEEAEKKKEKRGGKKSFMERMMDQSAEAQEQLEKQQAMRKNSAVSLKNYVASEQAQKVMENRNEKKYKEGSIGAKANIMMNYNNQNKKEEE